MDILLLESRQTSGSELLVTSSLVGAATLGGELTSHTGGRKSSCGVRRVLGHSTLGVKTDNWVGAVGYQQLVEAAYLGGGLLTSYTGLEENQNGSSG